MEMTIKGKLHKALPIETYTSKAGEVQTTRDLEFLVDGYRGKTEIKVVRVPASLDIKPDKDGMVSLTGYFEGRVYVSALKQFISATILEMKK